MLADSRIAYIKYPDIMQFPSATPTVYDQTKVLAAKIGKYTPNYRGNEQNKIEPRGGIAIMIKKSIFKK